jgi:hypothetical protein
LREKKRDIVAHVHDENRGLEIEKIEFEFKKSDNNPITVNVPITYLSQTYLSKLNYLIGVLYYDSEWCEHLFILENVHVLC